MSRGAKRRAMREAQRLRNDAANAEFDRIDWRYFGDFPQLETDEHGLTAAMRSLIGREQDQGI